GQSIQQEQFKRMQGGAGGFGGGFGGARPGGGTGVVGGVNQGYNRQLNNLNAASQQYHRLERKQAKPRNPTEMVSVNEMGGKKPAVAALPTRMAIVVASFPYKKQIEEHKAALRLPTVGQVLTELVPGEKGKTWHSFAFNGLEVERMTLQDDGRDG